MIILQSQHEAPFVHESSSVMNT